MSTNSEIIIFKDKIPDVTKIVALAAQEGVALRFPNGFDLANPPADYLNYEVDGEKVMFGLSVFPITNLDFVESEERGAPLPKKARKYGDTIMSFQTKGILSGQALLFIQTILAKNYNAAAVFDEEFLTPADLTKEFVPPADMMPELAATFVGTPSQRAAAMEKYFEKVQSELHLKVEEENTPKSKLDLLNCVIKWLENHKLEYSVFIIALLGLFIWGFLNAKH